jgi:probable phosphoglycerate mutase
VSLPKLVLVVRHAQSVHHVQGLTGGWTDTPLTEAGHEQARALAARLKRELPERAIALYTSDLQRAMQTAEHIGAAFGVAPIPDPRLREHNNGEAANMTFAAARERFASAFDHAWHIDERPFPGGETGRELYARAAAFIDGLCEDGRVPVVLSHGMTIDCLIARWLRLPPEALEKIGFRAYPTGLTALVRDRFDLPAVERSNDLTHLAGDGFGLDQLMPKA